MTIYLYVKTHNNTGLKYLGKTTAKDPHKYPGSGVYWKNHLKVHGINYSTKIIKECQSKEEVKEWGLYYSTLWNIVTAKDKNGKKLWANAIPETGEGGGIKGKKHSEVTKEKFRNKVWTEKALANLKEIGLRSAALRKGKAWSNSMRQSRLNSYIEKNLEIAKKIIQLSDQGYNKLSISKQLDISWNKVNYTLKYKTEFSARMI